MVRNAASTPNLRDNMNAPAPAFQLRGADDYTKSLMNRIATGQATDTERLLFDERVQNMQNYDPTDSSPPTFPGVKIEGLSSEAVQPLQDHQMRLMLLEQQNKKRLLMARQGGALNEDTSIPSKPADINEPPVKDTQADSDYLMQLKLLEQQNKKRLLMERQEKDATMDVRRVSPQNQGIFHPTPGIPVLNSPIIATSGTHEGTGSQPNVMGGSGFTSGVLELPPALSKRAPKPKHNKPSKKAQKVSIPIGGPAQDLGQETATANDNLALGSEHPDFLTPFEPTAELEELTLSDKPGKKNKKKKDKQKKLAKLVEFQEEAVEPPRATREAASVYTKPFCDFLTDNPTVFHAVDSQKKQLLDLGWTELDERKKWDLVPGGKYFVERNGSSMIAFTVGEKYKPGNGCAIIAGHVDALTAKLKPVSEVTNKAGYQQLGVAPYAGALNSTWWDRDLGIGGRVLVKEGDKIVTKLVKLDWPIARIPTLAPHFGSAAAGPFNKETQMVPIIGLEGTETADRDIANPFSQPRILGGNFISTQPPALVRAIGNTLGLSAATYGTIVSWELELFDIQPATLGGLNKEFIFAGRLDDKLCSWAAMQALISDHGGNDTSSSSAIKMVGWFDNEEIGSQLRQGAKSNFLPLTIERVVGCLGHGKKGANLVGRTYANSFLVSSDVTHAVNPNFLGAYLENHAPHLNVGLCAHADPNGNMTTDAVSTAILQRCVDSVGANLQVFQIRNDSRSGGTVGPMLSAMTGIRAIDAGLPQLSMHSIRATTGSLDPGLGVIAYMGFLNRFEHVDKEFGK